MPVEPHGPAYSAPEVTHDAVLQEKLKNKEELFYMKSKILISARALSLLLLVSAICGSAQERKPVHFSGVFNDYSPLSSISGSPYEMHGQWTFTNGAPLTSWRI